MFKVNTKNNDNAKNTNVRRHSGVFIFSFKHISHLFLVFVLLTLNQ